MAEGNGDKMKQGLFQGKVLEQLKNLDKNMNDKFVEVHKRFDKQEETDTAQDDAIKDLQNDSLKIKTIGLTISTIFTIVMTWLGFKGGGS